MRDKNREVRLRRRAAKPGLALVRRRGETTGRDNSGGYMVIDADRTLVVSGDLDAVEAFLSEGAGEPPLA